ncbi:FMN-dependent NADH-azoreductase [Oryzomonas rubra]|uniref:FMN dependent NADH:quinone oxidoreductase n=1 Tax=Oryzomonas rubra TaxID=2509454 RepID=A0A5A9XBC5_9BACT|nr:NAD(P)H-dependent oxidoreductase [Oryzomonas rubra]KAA0890387.1 FMN-dependent NADH-azoreductase [Oryzomonas rubra]
MANLLYVTCNLKPVEQSRSLTAAREFLETYLRYNPNDQVDFLDVYRDPIQRIDSDVLTGWRKLREGNDFAALAAVEQKKIQRINSTADQFIAADKYVFVTPMWNLSFPAEMKMYLDSVCVVGKTFIYTEKGPVGLLNGLGKKCLHIHSNGGFHFGREEDHSVPYLKSLMHFMGIENFQSVVIEGVDARPHQVAELMIKGCDACRFAAATF